jgi:hypothetical protein
MRDIENKALVLDLLEWLAARPRPYREVMEAWRTSCPRLPIWEDCVDLGLVARAADAAGTQLVHLSPTGRELLSTERPATLAPTP